MITVRPPRPIGGAPDLVDTRCAAAYLGVTVQRLAVWRTEGRGPAFIRVGRLIRYAAPDLAAWVEANRVPTATGGDAA